tara:strand:- start:657 stop:944 length:288 start_codon:yes stop_codon:yes gene_type:complete
MEINNELLNVFLSLHNRKAKTTKEPTVYLVQKDDCLKADSPLVAWKEQHLVNYFDHESKQFQWLMKQLKTYDCEKEVILGIFSDNKTVFSEVLKK